MRGGALLLAEQLVANPYLTKARAAEVLGATLQGASYAISQLVKTGIVSPAGKVGRARVFVCQDVLSVLEAPEP